MTVQYHPLMMLNCNLDVRMPLRPIRINYVAGLGRSAIDESHAGKKNPPDVNTIN